MRPGIVGPLDAVMKSMNNQLPKEGRSEITALASPIRRGPRTVEQQQRASRRLHEGSSTVRRALPPPSAFDYANAPYTARDSRNKVDEREPKYSERRPATERGPSISSPHTPGYSDREGAYEREDRENNKPMYDLKDYYSTDSPPVDLEENSKPPPNSLMRQLNQSVTWYESDPYEFETGSRKCLCEELNESFAWLASDGEQMSSESDNQSDGKSSREYFDSHAMYGEEHKIRRTASY